MKFLRCPLLSIMKLDTVLKVFNSFLKDKCVETVSGNITKVKIVVKRKIELDFQTVNLLFSFFFVKNNIPFIFLNVHLN